MSEVYIKEPPVNGKAVFHTTHGDLEMELWANEAPKACRNFCQLILEGYFNGNLFHRVIKDFCIQTGDATNTGDGGESIYGKPYPDEIHPRLKFRYRGMMGIASAGKNTNTNASQFFIVLNRIPSLDGKHTLFGKVVGQTIYNLARMSDLEVDKNDRPFDPPRVIRAELVWDPFGDLEPRRLPEPPKPLKSDAVHRRAPVKSKAKMSFANSDDESDDDPATAPASKGKSAHDLLDDARLKKEAAYPASKQAARDGGAKRAAAQEERGREQAASASSGAAAARKPAKVAAPPSESEEEDSVDYANSDSDGGPDARVGDKATQAASLKRQKEILELKRGIANVRPDAPEAKKSKRRASALEELRAGYQAREKREVVKGKDGKRKEAAAMKDFLGDFKKRLHGAVEDHNTDEADNRAEKAADVREKADDGTFAALWQEGDEAADEDWLNGIGLKFHVSADKAFKLDRDRAAKTLEIFDPLARAGNQEVLAEAQKKYSSMAIPQKRRKGDVVKAKGDGKGEGADFWPR